jgi:hypothetical protein
VSTDIPTYTERLAYIAGTGKTLAHASGLLKPESIRAGHVGQSEATWSTVTRMSERLAAETRSCLTILRVLRERRAESGAECTLLQAAAEARHQLVVLRTHGRLPSDGSNRVGPFPIGPFPTFGPRVRADGLGWSDRAVTAARVARKSRKANRHPHGFCGYDCVHAAAAPKFIR